MDQQIKALLFLDKLTDDVFISIASELGEPDVSRARLVNILSRGGADPYDIIVRTMNNTENYVQVIPDSESYGSGVSARELVLPSEEKFYDAIDPYDDCLKENNLLRAKVDQLATDISGINARQSIADELRRLANSFDPPRPIVRRPASPRPTLDPRFIEYQDVQVTPPPDLQTPQQWSPSSFSTSEEDQINVNEPIMAYEFERVTKPDLTKTDVYKQIMAMRNNKTYDE